MADRQVTGAEPVGWVVAGPASSDRGGLAADWDGEVHPTIEAGLAQLRWCREAGYETYQLYALTPTQLDPTEAGDPT